MKTPDNLTVREIADMFHQSNDPEVVRDAVMAIGTGAGGIYTRRGQPNDFDRAMATKRLCDRLNTTTTDPRGDRP